MEILTESKRILAYAGLGIDAYVQIGNKTIPRALIRYFIIFILVLAISLHMILCLNNYTKGLIVISVPIGASLTCLSIILIYIDLVLTTEHILQLFNYLQDVINKSRVFLWSEIVLCSPNLPWVSSIFIYFFVSVIFYRFQKEFDRQRIHVPFIMHEMHSLIEWHRWYFPIRVLCARWHMFYQHCHQYFMQFLDIQQLNFGLFHLAFRIREYL